MLADKLNMGIEESERWIVNLIRNASLDAKIDSQRGTVVMGSQALSPYQTIIEKTKNLFNRTQNLAQNSDKRRDTTVSSEPSAVRFHLHLCLAEQLDELSDPNISEQQCSCSID